MYPTDAVSYSKVPCKNFLASSNPLLLPKASHLKISVFSQRRIIWQISIS